jgi:CheY-like chemotaxis protein
VLPASTTREGEEILDRIQPGLIILDIVLRSEETWAFAAKLKQDSRTKGIPVIVVSTIEDQAKGFHLGVDRYLIKPIDRFELITELRAVTGQQPGGRVLIIDDEERDRYVLKQKLRHLPLLIVEAATGMEGFRKACNYKPNLIFLDIGMPDLSGFEVLENLKAEPHLAAIPVVIVTSQVLTDSERNELAKNAIAIVSKENLEHTDFADVLQRATNEGLLPASAH